MEAPASYSAVWTRVTALLFLLVGCGSGLGLLGKLDLVRAVFALPVPPSLLTVLLTTVILLFVGTPFFFRIALRHKQAVAWLSVAGILIASLVLFPKIAALHAIGRGSDQSDCIVVASHRLLALRWPYDTSLMWTHNAMSCGAGWVLLQAPIVASAGYAISQVIVCLLAFLLIGRAAGKQFAFSLAALIALCPGIWLCAVDGSDFLLFGIALAAILVTAHQIERVDRSRLSLILFVVLAALVFQFRTPFVIMPGLLRRSIGAGKAFLIGLIAIAMQTAFFVWNPASYIEDGPMHLIKKTFGHTDIADKPHVLIPVVVVCLILELAVTLSIGRFMGSLLASFSVLLILLGVPALVDLARKLHEHTTIVQALGSWEGGPWLAACVPLAALLLLSALPRESRPQAGQEALQQPILSEQEPDLVLGV